MLKVPVDVRKDKEVRAKPSAVIVHNQHRAAQYNMMPIDTGFSAHLDNRCRVVSVRCVSESLSSRTKHKFTFEGRLLTCGISLMMKNKKVAVHLKKASVLIGMYVWQLMN